MVYGISYTFDGIDKTEKVPAYKVPAHIKEIAHNLINSGIKSFWHGCWHIEAKEIG